MKHTVDLFKDECIKIEFEFVKILVRRRREPRDCRDLSMPGQGLTVGLVEVDVGTLKDPGQSDVLLVVLSQDGEGGEAGPYRPVVRRGGQVGGFLERNLRV